MENSQQNPELRSISKGALLIEKVHNCADCPIRKMAVQQPRSIFALLHIWHKSWWPGWKAHQARVCVYRAMAKPQGQ